MRTALRRRNLAILLALPLLGFTANAPQKKFSTPQEAAHALLIALQSDSDSLFLAIAGPPMAGFWNSGDSQRDAAERHRFVDAARLKGFKFAPIGEHRTLLYVGDLEDPFPAPVIETAGGWQFDAETGAVEVAVRRVRRNEVAAVEQCRRFREAEFAYLRSAGLEMRVFAEKIRSTAGQRDGLFWSDGEAVDESPLGPPFAAAAFAELQPPAEARPLFGYYFKVLVAQGPAATGGALNYRVKGQLRRGFALVAWPARYGIDGVRSFLINHFGDVYQKDLGSETDRAAPAMWVFNPDATWTKLEGEEPAEDSSSLAIRPE